MGFGSDDVWGPDSGAWCMSGDWGLMGGPDMQDRHAVRMLMRHETMYMTVMAMIHLRLCRAASGCHVLRFQGCDTWPSL